MFIVRAENLLKLELTLFLCRFSRKASKFRANCEIWLDVVIKLLLIPQLYFRTIISSSWRQVLYTSEYADRATREATTFGGPAATSKSRWWRSNMLKHTTTGVDTINIYLYIYIRTRKWVSCIAHHETFQCLTAVCAGRKVGGDILLVHIVNIVKRDLVRRLCATALCPQLSSATKLMEAMCGLPFNSIIYFKTKTVTRCWWKWTTQNLRYVWFHIETHYQCFAFPIKLIFVSVAKFDSILWFVWIDY